MRVLGRLALAVGIVAATTGVASADDTTPKWVRAELAGTSARLDAHFEFDVDDGMHASFATLELPANGIATGAIVSADGVTRRLVLEPAEAANQQLDELLHGEPGEDRPWVVRITGSGQMVDLDFGAPVSARVDVDLEVETGTCFFHDARFVQIPADWTRAARAAAPRGADFASACGEGDTWLAFPDRALAGHEPGEARIGATTARLPLAHEDLASLELAIAGQLGAVPADLDTAIVVDASRSLTANRARAQRAIVASYLAAARGRVQVIGYARDAHAVLADWSDALGAAHAIDDALAALPPRNGSNLDAGLAEAARWLSRVHGTRRIVVLTDELVPHRLEAIDQDALARTLPDHTLVHVVALEDDDEVELRRDDDALFAPLAATTFGMAVLAATNAHRDADATMLARPVSLDHVAVDGVGWTQRDLPCAGVGLAEGTSCTWLAGGDASSARDVVITGDIWGRHFERSLELDRGEARTLARRLSVQRDLPGDEQAEIDLAAEAVNAAWALFVRWGGGDSYGDQGGAIGSFGIGGSSSTHCSGVAGVHLAATVDLRPQLAPVLARCGAAPHAHVALDLELTRSEIVAVDATVTGDGATPAFHDCIVEATWQTLLELPASSGHRDLHVDLR